MVLSFYLISPNNFTMQTESIESYYAPRLLVLKSCEAA